jgi:hypothetical protein
MITVVDLFRHIVGKTSDKVKDVIKSDVFYQFGHIAEINNTLKSYSATAEFSKQKYPAIFLLQDFIEQKLENPAIETQVNLQLLIVAASDKSYRASERYEKVFKPVLYPVYETLIKVIKQDSRLINEYGNIPHNKIDRLLISGFQMKTQSGTANLFSDYLDAIEINNLKLTIKKICNYGL